MQNHGRRYSARRAIPAPAAPAAVVRKMPEGMAAHLIAKAFGGRPKYVPNEAEQWCISYKKVNA